MKLFKYTRKTGLNSDCLDLVVDIDEELKPKSVYISADNYSKINRYREQVKFSILRIVRLDDIQPWNGNWCIGYIWTKCSRPGMDDYLHSWTGRRYFNLFNCIDEVSHLLKMTGLMCDLNLYMYTGDKRKTWKDETDFLKNFDSDNVYIRNGRFVLEHDGNFKFAKTQGE